VFVGSPASFEPIHVWLAASTVSFVVVLPLVSVVVVVVVVIQDECYHAVSLASYLS